MRDNNVIGRLNDAIEQGRAAALVTLISAQGSTPRECAAKMLVYDDGSIVGTVGGGKLEALAIKEALLALKKGASRKVKFRLTPQGIGMVCMGEVEIFIDVFVPSLKILILGAGHVGEKIAQAAAVAGISYQVADEREAFANAQKFPEGRILVCRPDLAVSKSSVDEKTYVVIVTRGHELDAQCLRKALRTKAAYIGMIGSRSKIPMVFKELNRQGFEPQKDKRVFAPIGVNCGGKTPGEIAISVLAEILAVHHKQDIRHMRVVPSNG